MRSVALFLVALSSSVFAVQITYPGMRDTWSTLGPNEVRWTSVSTDAPSFQVVLSTPTLQRTELASSVASSANSLVVTSPSGGFPAGVNYRINFIDLNNGGILAESAQFNITAGAGTATGSLTASISSGAPTTATGATTKPTVTAAGTGTTGAATTGGATPPPVSPSSGASPAIKASGALIGMLSAVYALVL